MWEASEKLQDAAHKVAPSARSRLRLIGLSAPTMLMPCSLVPWFQEYEVQLGGTREIIRRKRPQRLSHGRLRRLTGKFSASCGQFFVVVRSQHGSLAPWLLHAIICTHLISSACGIPRFFSRFARRAGLVHLRQTFVLRCHGDDGWPLRAEAWHFCATTSSRRMVRTIQCPTYSTISPHRVSKGLARIGIAAAFTMSSLSRARDSSFERHLEACGVDLYLDQQAIDTTTPM